MAIVFVGLFLAFAYLGIMAGYLRGWLHAPTHQPDINFCPTTAVTVIIPARNEAPGIADCLHAVLACGYPVALLEIIVVDDFSHDGTAQTVETWSKNYKPGLVRLIKLSEMLPPQAAGAPNKKKAIETAVAQAKGDIIVATDADCAVPANWLAMIVSFFAVHPNCKILTGPVGFYRESNLLQRFQALDFLGTMGITCAGIEEKWHVMGNGANLAYRKSAFQQVNGYAGNDRIASGDDMFLLQKMQEAWPGCVGFLKNKSAMVLTEAPGTWAGFFQQRLRWGTKNAALPDWNIRLVLLAVFLFCWSIWVNLLLTFMGQISWQVVVFQLVVKAAADWALLRTMCHYFDRKGLLRWFWPSFVLHTGYIAFVGLASLFFRNYHWKGRVGQ